MKKTVLLLMLVLTLFTLSACTSPGYTGSWKLDKINGMPVAEYVAASGINVADFPEGYFDLSLEVTEVNMTVTSHAGDSSAAENNVSTLDIDAKSDGFEALIDKTSINEDGSEKVTTEVAFSVLYDSAMQTLSYTINRSEGIREVYTYVRK